MPQKNALKRVKAVDLYCGIGGLTHGLELAGVSVKAGFDVDATCQFAYEENNPETKFVHTDIRKINFSEIEPFYENGDVRVLVGCAPCQPFSAHTRRVHGSRKEDCLMVKEFGRLVKEGIPDIVSMENVPGLAKHQAFDEFLLTLDNLGYIWNFDILQCADFGIPQKRKRLVLLASQLGKISLPCSIGEKKTVGDFIRHLPPIKDGEVSHCDTVHTSLELSEINRKRIRQSKPGGSWKDWDKSILSECHKRKAYYPAPYGRMSWDNPAPTITTQFCYYSTGRFGHPEQHRTISIREAALIQTFPSQYKFTEKTNPIVIRELARHIGNAVPVKLAAAIGNSIVDGANV